MNHELHVAEARYYPVAVVLVPAMVSYVSLTEQVESSRICIHKFCSSDIPVAIPCPIVFIELIRPKTCCLEPRLLKQRSVRLS